MNKFHIARAVTVGAYWLTREEALLLLTIAITVLQMILDFYSKRGEKRAS